MAGGAKLWAERSVISRRRDVSASMADLASSLLSLPTADTLQFQGYPEDWSLGRRGRMRRLPTLPRPSVVQRQSLSLRALSWARMQCAQKASSVTVVSRMSKVDSGTVLLAVSWIPNGMGKESGR